jgi:uncharacterized protein YraI
MKMTRKMMQFQAALTSSDIADKRSRLSWRILITILLLTLVAVLSLLLQGAGRAHAAPPSQSMSQPLVLAFYYTWFDENTWTYDKLPDLPAEQYVSRDRSAMGRHIDQAKAAGIDGFLVAWYGPGGGNQTEANLTALLEEAAVRDFKIGILFETDSPFIGGADGVVSALKHALSVHASQHAFLRADGRPVIFFWRPSLYGAGAWATIRGQVDPGNSAIWVAEGVDTSLLTIFDGHYLYSNTWNPPADLMATNQKFARQVAAMRQSTGAPRLWVATVMPGYNDVRVRPGAGFARDREDGAYYAQSWQAAIASAPNWVVLTSFNEWPEGTYIEPSIAHGDQYLGLTATWASQFKGGGGAAVAIAPLPEPDQPTAYVTTALLNLRAGPGTGYAIVGQATSGSALPLTGRAAGAEDWWQVDAGGGIAWVNAALVRAAGPLDTVPAVAAPAVAAPETAASATVADSGNATSAATAAGSIVVVTADAVNLRAGPGTGHTLVGMAVAGVMLPVRGRTADAAWWQVDTAVGPAWVFGELVHASADASSAPIVDTAPAVQPGAALTSTIVSSATVTITSGGQTFTLRVKHP